MGLCLLDLHEVHRKKHASLKSRAVRRVHERRQTETRILLLWKRGGIGLIERAEVLAKLDISLSNVPGERDMLNTKFTVSNGSSYEISARHELLCYINLETAKGGPAKIHGVRLGQLADGTYEMYSGEIDRRRFPVPTSNPLHPHGDAQTDSCIYVMGFIDGPSCADIEVSFDYYLQDQPEELQEKKAHLVAHLEDTGTFVWFKEPIESTTNYCQRYVKD